MAFKFHHIPNEQQQNSISTPDISFINNLISTFDYIQFLAILGFYLLLGFSILLWLKLKSFRIYFWKKRTTEDFDFSNSKYRPVVCIHGLMGSPKSYGLFVDVIQKNHLGTSVHILDAYNGVHSLKPLWEQIEVMRLVIENICKEHPEGINLIGISQGAILARGVLETSDKHNVDTFVSIAGPHMGLFGIPFINDWLGSSYLVRNLFRLFYTKNGQNLSVAEYWKDPNHLSVYEETCIFLPKLNNEIKHPDSERFKTNFSRVKNLILIGGPDDGVITPWQSSHFAYFDEHRNLVEMKDQSIYKNDSFGLRTLDERKAITVYSVPNLAHFSYIFSELLIKQYILPHLN